jgi:hypothetical protein
MIWLQAPEDRVMAPVDQASAAPGSARVARVALWCTAVVAVTFIALLAGVGLAALAGQRGDADFWGRLSDVGQAFGVLSSIISGLALTAVVITSRAHSRELQEGRRELERQRQLLTESHAELQRTAEANRGQLHLEILKLAIDDPGLAEVWPPFTPGLSVQENRQYLYANIIYQHQQTWMRSGGHSEEEVLNTMRYLFTSRIMRDYWRGNERARASLVPGTEEHRLAQKVDELWHEYEAVLAAHREAPRGSVRDFPRPEPNGSDPSPSGDPPAEPAAA